MTHHTASTQQKVLRRQGIGQGRRTQDTGTRVPMGEMHAVTDDDTLTFCGRSVSSLHDFPEQDFAVGLGTRCHECSVGAGLIEV